MQKYKEITLTDILDLNLIGTYVEFYIDTHYLSNTPYGYEGNWFPAVLDGIINHQKIEHGDRDINGFLGTMHSIDYEFALEFPTEICTSSKIRVKICK